ncbi:hypothetical protein A7A76_07875 [Lysobacter enzymogenes]|nr:hypothetical protein [Lysobacter enzymogenes]
MIMIEVFAYFFLRLYKQSIEEIKYYQNELTNVEFKWAAVTMAKQAGGEPVLLSIIDNLVKTERNFILEKGESTVGLEKERISAATYAEVLRNLGGVLKRER